MWCGITASERYRVRSLNALGWNRGMDNTSYYNTVPSPLLHSPPHSLALGSRAPSSAEHQRTVPLGGLHLRWAKGGRARCGVCAPRAGVCALASVPLSFGPNPIPLHFTLQPQTPPSLHLVLDLGAYL